MCCVTNERTDGQEGDIFCHYLLCDNIHTKFTPILDKDKLHQIYHDLREDSEISLTIVLEAGFCDTALKIQSSTNVLMQEIMCSHQR